MAKKRKTPSTWPTISLPPQLDPPLFGTPDDPGFHRAVILEHRRFFAANGIVDLAIREAAEALVRHGHDPRLLGQHPEGGKLVTDECPTECHVARKILTDAHHAARVLGDPCLPPGNVLRAAGVMEAGIVNLRADLRERMAQYGTARRDNLRDAQGEGQHSQAVTALENYAEYRAHYNDLITRGRQHTAAIQATAKRFGKNEKTIRRALAARKD
jgi:hypothetical protein